MPELKIVDKEFIENFDHRGICEHCGSADTKEYNSATKANKEGMFFEIFKVCLTCNQ